MIEFRRDLQLSSNFQLWEFLKSESHPSALDGVILQEPQILKLYYLCKFALQPVRDKFGWVHVTSGFRTPMLNKLLNGSSDTSQHLLAEAADFVCPNSNMGGVFDFLDKELEWSGQVFYYRLAGHCHVGLPRPGVPAIHRMLED